MCSCPAAASVTWWWCTCRATVCWTGVGRLYFAAADTVKTQLASTGIPSAWLLDQLDDCRARRQVLILDCCFSGAFAHGSKGGADLDLERRLAGHGRGRAVLTASRAGEYSFEGQALAGAAVAGSVFTTGLVEGLRTGAADLGGDGYVSLDEAYDYAYRYVQSRSASQTPQRWLYGGEGAIVLARSPAWAATAAAAEERKLATVLIAELAGPAELAADQDPERVRAVLDRFYDAMAAEVERAGGTVEKFAGDAAMAAFGAPRRMRTTRSGPCTWPWRCSGDRVSCSAAGWRFASA